MRGVCALAVAVAALVVLPAVPASAAVAKPPTVVVLSSIPVNGHGQVLLRVRRGHPVTLRISFKVGRAPEAAAYRVRVSAELVLGKHHLKILSKRAPTVYTGVYRYSLPLKVPRGWPTGKYALVSSVEVLKGQRVRNLDRLGRMLRVK